MAGEEEDEVVCDACGFEASFVPEGMIQCVRCRTANYCSVTCLQWHWKSGGHSRTCIPVAVEDDNEEDDTNTGAAEDSRSSIQTEPSLVSMDMNHLFDSATAHTALTKASSSSAVSVEESMSSATTTPASNQIGAVPSGGGSSAAAAHHKVSPFVGLQRVNAAWEEKAKGMPPSSTTADPSKDGRRGGGGGLNLGTFFENQKKQSSPVAAKKEAAPPHTSPALVVPMTMMVENDDDEEEVIIEEYEEEEEVMSLDLLNEDSGHDNLKSIVEESEVTGDDPDFEGSWRSREPFAKGGAWASPHSSPPSVSSSSNHSNKMSQLQQQMKQQRDGGGMRAVIEDVFEETTEVEEVVEESTSFLEEEMTEGDDSKGNESKHSSGSKAFGSPGQTRATAQESSSSVVSSSGTWKQSPTRSSSGGSSASPRSSFPSQYSSTRTHRAMRDEDDENDPESSASNSVDALMNQYGYDSAMDDDDSRGGGSCGSLNAETGGDTTRTDDTSRLAAQPAFATAAAAAPRLIDDDTGTSEDDDDDRHAMLRPSSGHPVSYLRQQQMLNEIDSLYSQMSSRDPDSSMGTITTEERLSSVTESNSVPPTGQDSREATSTGASTGQQSKEEGPGSVVVGANPVMDQRSQRLDSLGLTKPPSREAAPTLLRSLSDSSQMSVTAAENLPEPNPLPSAASPLERRHSGPSKNAASSLLDFRNVYGGNRSSSTTMNANSLKDFRLAYVATAPAPETPSSITSTLTSHSHVNLSAVSPPPEAHATRVGSVQATEDCKMTDALDGAPESSSCNPLTVSINKALVDYERVFGKEAATKAFIQLTQGAASPAGTDPVETQVLSLAPKLFASEGLAPEVASQPVVVAVMSNGEDVPSDLSSSIGRDGNAGSASRNIGPLTSPSSAGREPSSPDSASRPRYMAYRNILSRSVGTPRSSEVKPSSDIGADTMDESSSGRETERDDDLVVASAALSPSPTLSVQFSDSTSHRDAESSLTPSPGRRYESYLANLGRSLLSPSKGSNEGEQSVQKPISNDDIAATASGKDGGYVQDSRDTPEMADGAGSMSSSPFDEQPSLAPISSSAVSEVQPRYLSYRQTIARRLPQTSATRSSDADVDDEEVKQRLSSYLQKGMAGTTEALTQVSKATSSEPHAIPSKEPLPTTEEFAPEPLKSRRAASALARAQEAQGLTFASRVSQGNPSSALNVNQSATQCRDLTVMRPSSFCDEKPSSYNVVEPNSNADLEVGLEDENEKREANGREGVRLKKLPKRAIITIAILAIVAIVVGATVGVLTTAGSSTDIPQTNSTAPNETAIDPSSQAPTSPPSVVPASDPQLLKLLSEVSDDQGDSLQQAGTPQNQAYSWLAGNLNLESYSDEQRIQRYAYATLYFGTAGESWNSSERWLSDDSECKWFSRSGRPCDDSGELTRLALASNNLQGVLPPEISLLSKLTIISLGENRLTSVLPTTLGRLSSLTRMSANNNGFAGPMISELGDLTVLEELDLHGNKLIGDIPTEIGRLMNLVTLDVSDNSLRGTIPSEMGRLVNMADLRLQSNRLEGPIPTEFSNLTRLADIRIEDNDLTGTVPTVVCDTFSVTLPSFYLDCGGSDPKLTCPPGPCCTYCCALNEGTGDSTCQCLYAGTGFDFLC